MVEHSPRKRKALGSLPSSEKKNKTNKQTNKIPPFWAEWKTVMTKVHGKPRALALLASWSIKWVTAEENTVLLS